LTRTYKKGLSTLTNLTTLSIQSNRLTSITGLDSLTALEELHISHNALTSLSGLEHNTNLRVIDISSNPIAKLEGLDAQEKLEELWASNCKFDSFEDVEGQLAGKQELKTVYFEGNPLQLRQPVQYRGKMRLALPRIRQIDASKFVRSWGSLLEYADKFSFCAA
jgi:protein phosphatase 1 regulatory subunit 7